MVKKYSMKIELLSDLCVSDGGVYNSLIDTDICYDIYGFPYIPAKRLKGCLRECGIELADWDSDPAAKEQELLSLFGDQGGAKNRAKLQIGNAYLEDYKEKVKLVRSAKSHPLLHPQNVLNYYSYVRSQTAIDYETGVADDTSLRTMRVSNKGLVFYADIELDDSYEGLLSDCCSILRHMGIARTRGLGEVRVSLEEKVRDEGHVDNSELVSEATYLEYEIELLEPMICKSVNAGEAYTLDYIEGSKILGFISERLKQSGEDYLDFVSSQKLICSNAYISIDGKRSGEIPGYLYKIKNRDDVCVNKLYETDDRKKEYEKQQLNQLKHGYAVIEGKTVQKGEVEVESRYHHRRPDDKSIGRAMPTQDGSDFYQMSSICKGQAFVGFITGTTGQIKRIYDLIKSTDVCHIGYASSSEYGLARIRVLSTKSSGSSIESETKDFVVRLNAPAIIYSDKAMATTDPAELREEILSALGLKDDDVTTDYYLRYTTVGGYNVTWNMRKPTLRAFDKGTSLAFHFKTPVKISSNNSIFIGERVSEGYGEIVAEPYDPDGAYTMTFKDGIENVIQTEINIEENDFLTEICEETMIEFIKDMAAKKAQEKFRGKTSWKPTVSNMALLINECANLGEVEEGINSRFGDKKSDKKSEKLEYAENILKAIRDDTDSVYSVFSTGFKVKGLKMDDDFIRMTYLKAYLTHAKYMLRREGA